MLATLSQFGQLRVRVAETGEFYAHAIHDREVEAAEFPVFVAGVGVVKDAAGFQCAADGK